MFCVLSDPAIYEFENVPPESEAWLHRRFKLLESRGPADGSEDWLNWVVRLPSGQLAGYVQATVSREGWAYVAYELNSQYWRQGIGKASVKAMLQELSLAYGVREFVAVLKARNFRSRALLLSLGFRDGSAEQVERHRDEQDEIVMVLA
ncbi:RimJ/RimL family protein N-acetyltransferase [Roseateles asaccharophilus]|uniref:RimJ/RimL family protein N-acetyltransferase n=2 Tax=Roseateles asaccharophilus TaxID=582607 RepID=A0A4R6N7W1_9BURK|nr:RimJ/RimL family protein N-acetyltransferase [Roseateles asaccharophilus]